MTEEAAKPALLISASYVLDPADTAAYKVLAARMAKAARARPGCVFLNAAQDVLDPETFHLTEGWASEHDLNAHLASEAFQSVLAAALKLRIRARSGTMYLIGGAQELDMPS
ncbi:putative quinol monooxygenase [Novosphingobium sp.]|uniref:putative quinol monooxygenase n=1 Tax=Novosphingobium sp. TaxID=1874826 RepID=UPI003BA865F0